MLNVKTSTSPSPIAALLPSAAAQAPGATPANEGPAQPSFAKMLQTHQAPAQAARVDKPAEPKAREQAHAETAHPTAASANRPAGPAREAAKARDASAQAPRHSATATKEPEAKDADASAPSVDGSDEAEDSDDSTVAADPALADWLAGLKLPDPSQAPLPLPAPLATPLAGATANGAASTDTSGTEKPGDGANPAAAADAAATAAAGNAAVIALGSGVTASAGAVAETGRDRPMPGARADSGGSGAGRIERNDDGGPRGAVRDGSDANLAALATASTAPGGQHGAGSDTGDGGTAGRGTQAPAWAPVASSAAGSPTATAFMPITQTALALQGGQSAAQPLPVNLQSPLGSPEFPQAMGAQLTLLAQNGIEHAELHLNPADMGPVSVQIEVQGTQARIDFGADVASTRQAIEASLPELASALRDAGLTLSGGGVSQHSRSRQDMADAQGSGRGTGNGRGDAGTGSETAPVPLRRSVRAGGVDAYA